MLSVCLDRCLLKEKDGMDKTYCTYGYGTVP